MTTNEALQHIFSDKKGFEKLNIGYSTWLTWRYRFREDSLSDELKDTIIEKYGGKLIQDKQWELPKPGDKNH